MISSFRSRALKKYWTRGDAASLRPDWRRKVGLLLKALDEVGAPPEMNLPGFGFHVLTGDKAGRYALTVSPNWRLTFGWDHGDAIDVDLEDYHGT